MKHYKHIDDQHISSSNIDKGEPHHVNYMCAKNWIPTTFGLGAVREQTYIHTNTLRATRIWIFDVYFNQIDIFFMK